MAVSKTQKSVGTIVFGALAVLNTYFIGPDVALYDPEIGGFVTVLLSFISGFFVKSPSEDEPKEKSA